MKRIAFFQNNFKVGGIQRALISILDNLDYSRYAVDVYYCDRDFFYELPRHENLRYIYFKPFPYCFRFVYFDIIKRFAGFPFSDEQYDAAVDFNSYSSECAAACLSVRADKHIMWIHNDMYIKHREEPKYRVLWHFFKGKFKYYDEFCAVSPGIIEPFRNMSGLKEAKVSVVQNFVDTSLIFRKAAEETDFTADEKNYNLCSMGRICRQKGFDILMPLFARALEQRPDMHLYIIGDGPDREKLEAQIKELGIEKKVSLLGSKSNPFPIVEKMDGFVLTSRYEGQGIVLWEAKSLGLELFMTENLEKYNPGLKGREDIVSDLVQAEKRDKHRDNLQDYNRGIIEQLEAVLG